MTVRFEEFCGGPVWDTNLTWNTNHPEFTQCFQSSVLVYIQCGFLWIIFPFYVGYWVQRRDKPGYRTYMYYARMVTVAVLLLISGINFIKGIGQYATSFDVTLSNIISPLLLILTYSMILYVINLEFNKGIISSGVLFLFFLLLVISGVIPMWSFCLHATQKHNFEAPLSFALYVIYYCTALVAFILFCFADLRGMGGSAQNISDRKPCPEVEASLLSKLTYWWMNDTLWLGYKKTLTEEDIWLPNPRDVTRRAAPPFEAAWASEVMKYNTTQTKLPPPLGRSVSHRSMNNHADESTPLLNPSSENLLGDVEFRPNQKSKKPSLFLALMKAYGLRLLESHVCKFIGDFLTMAGPIIQRLLINYTVDESIEAWKGYLFAALFFATTVINSVLYQRMYQLGNSLGMRIHASLVSAIYRKALRISNDARNKTTVGEIVNLMSVDADRLQDVTSYLWMFWSAPLQIGLAIFLLYDVLGASVFAGLATFVVLFPINGYVASIETKLQEKEMKLKDSRIKITNELLSGIKVVKLNAWEYAFEEKVNEIRHKELKNIRTISFLAAFGNFSWSAAPFIVTLITFATYILTGGVLDAAKAFTAMSLFNILTFPTTQLPMMISYSVMAYVSVNRLRDFLLTDDIDEESVEHKRDATDAVVIENGTFAWKSDAEDSSATLENINLTVQAGKLCAVAGPVGCGKSSIISALLGEMLKLNGNVTICGSIAYVAQQPWIQNMTLRDNILFGSPYDEQKYNKVLDACALMPDLEMLPSRDMTEIGEKGINLSGGQKQRISIARAVYADRDVYLFDDALSAVDTHVGKQIFNQVISGSTALLANKTRILVTHGLHWLPSVDTIVVMSDGEITETGSYEKLLSHNGPFAQFLKTYLNTEDAAADPEVQEIRSKILQRIDSIPIDSEVVVGSPSRRAGRRRLNSRLSVTSEDSQISNGGVALSRQTSLQPMKEEPAVTSSTSDRLIQEEGGEVGSVKASVFLEYFRAMSLPLSILLCVTFVCYEASSVLSSVWLSRWTDDAVLNNQSLINTSIYIQHRDVYLGVFGGFGGLQVIFVLLHSILMACSCVRASKILHSRMLTQILHSPLSFFETTPTGRILNRFSHDIEAVDNILPMVVEFWLITLLGVVSTIIVVSYSTPIFLVVFVPLAIIYFFVQRIYIPTSRQLKRISSATRSPIYAHFSETLAGVSTIRAYGTQQRFIEESEAKVDHNLVYYYANITAYRWLGLRLEFLGAVVVLFAALFSVIGRGHITGGLVGLSITYALQFTENLNWLVRLSSDVETNMVSVERIKEYSDLKPELAWTIDGSLPSEDWPTTGRVQFDNYSTRYRPELDLVLRRLSLIISHGEKIGVVGRTGAGKSSITLALFRILEAAEGEILIDGQPISTVGLHQLRSRLTILPQDPVLFSGSLRMNVDPLGQYTDIEIWTALEHSHLKTFVQELATGLDYECGESGLNLSVGQRQLVCLARALLKKTKVLILDEATAAVDMETDELIQKTIKENFTDCTVISIAHRLNTIMDYDRILVMDAGEIAECDSPSNLLNNKSSKFYAMAKDANLIKNDV